MYSPHQRLAIRGNVPFTVGLASMGLTLAGRLVTLLLASGIAVLQGISGLLPVQATCPKRGGPKRSNVARITNILVRRSILVLEITYSQELSLDTILLWKLACAVLCNCPIQLNERS